MSDNSKDVVIVEAVRTPIGTYNGSLKDIRAHQLGSIVIKEVLKRSNVNPDEVDEIIMGQVLTAGMGQNPARQAAINAGIPVSKPAYIVNQVCGSGLRAIISGFQSIKLGDSKIVISGGQENMSIAPKIALKENEKKNSENKFLDVMMNDGLLDAFKNYDMGVTAENVAKKFNISREEQDEFALNSQKKTLAAIKNNNFEKEIIEVNLNGNTLKLDEHPRNNLTLKDLQKLKTVFQENGTVTAGNSSGINDGAASLMLLSLEESEKKSLEALARIVSWASVGVDPSLMGLGPIGAIKEAVKKANWKLEDIDLFEINEAFAAQTIAVIRELNIDISKVNINGGAIALGHPIGASGARILISLIYQMKKFNKKKGCASLCIGGGMGIAICVERN